MSENWEKLGTLDEYLKLGARLYFAHHKFVEHPLKRDDYEIEMQQFLDWLFGEEENFVVIQGGLSIQGED